MTKGRRPKPPPNFYLSLSSRLPTTRQHSGRR
nr:MAG TPA: hypothetical protein [Bacteriophage sp.]